MRDSKIWATPKLIELDASETLGGGGQSPGEQLIISALPGYNLQPSDFPNFTS